MDLLKFDKRTSEMIEGFNLSVEELDGDLDSLAQAFIFDRVERANKAKLLSLYEEIEKALPKDKRDLMTSLSNLQTERECQLVEQARIIYGRVIKAASTLNALTNLEPIQVEASKK